MQHLADNPRYPAIMLRWHGVAPIAPRGRDKGDAMLAEKFFLVLETLISRTNPDGGPRVESTSRQIPIKLPRQSGR
jgi:hypothetical protein